MQFLSDGNFWLGAINLVGIVIVFVFNYLSHQKIVGNDLHHLAKDLKDIAEKQDKQDDKINDIANDVAYIKGKEENNDKIIKILEKSINK